MYEPHMMESIYILEKTRSKRMKQELPLLSSEEKYDLLHKFHPDYKKGTLRELKVGPNKGEKVIQEIADLFEAHSQIDPNNLDISEIDYDVDVLVIGGGGAGASAALTAQENKTNVLLATKLRLGDSNTMMAQGGIQAADKPNDSPPIHFLDVVGGGGSSSFVAETPISSVEETPTKAEPTTGDTKACTNCGATNEHFAAFCTTCGAAL